MTGELNHLKQDLQTSLNPIVRCSYWQHQKLNGGIALSGHGVGVRIAHGAVIAHSMLEQLDPTHTF
jgi:hypothetical protein